MDIPESLANDVTKLLADPDFQQLERQVREYSLLSLVGATHLERWHSAFLAWLLNPEAEHGLGVFPLRMFLIATNLSVQNKGVSTDKIKKPPLADLLESEFDNIDLMPDVHRTNNKCEKTVNIDNTNRLFDVALTALLKNKQGERDNKLLLIVEVKINAKEGKDQTVSYADWAQNPTYPISNTVCGKNKYDGYKVLVFLSPKGLKPKSEHFIPMSYQYLLDNVLTPCYNNPGLSERGHILIGEYIHALSNAKICITDLDMQLAKAIINKHSSTLNRMCKIAKAEGNKSEGENSSSVGSADQQVIKFIDSVFRDKTDVFERIAKTKVGSFTLPNKYTYVNNYKYELLKQHLDKATSTGSYKVKYKGKNIEGEINLDTKPPKIIINGKEMTAAKATQEASGNTKSRWAENWCVLEDTHHAGKTFLALYEELYNELIVSNAE